MGYSYPDYPKGCPPSNCIEECGTYYRVAEDEEVKKEHFQSYYELGIITNPKRCDGRAVSLRRTREQAIELINSLGDSIGNYLFEMQLKGGHGIIQHNNSESGHCNWWIPKTVDPTKYAVSIEGPL
ncbi:MAG: hypothetical protein ACRDF4_01540 [Rhabdochlamydiaceae bacterium]